MLAAGAGACCVGTCVGSCVSVVLSIIPVVGCFAGLLSLAIISGSIGTAEAFVGDRFSNVRGVILWPALASAGILLVTTGIATVIIFVAYGAALGGILTGNNVGAAIGLIGGGGAFLAAGGVYALGALAAIGVPAILYFATAEEKQPDDTGEGFPGIIAPAHPKPATPPAAKATATRMAY
jgi:hypothetical protein